MIYLLSLFCSMLTWALCSVRLTCVLSFHGWGGRRAVVARRGRTFVGDRDLRQLPASNHTCWPQALQLPLSSTLGLCGPLQLLRQPIGCSLSERIPVTQRPNLGGVCQTGFLSTDPLPAVVRMLLRLLLHEDNVPLRSILLVLHRGGVQFQEGEV